MFYTATNNRFNFSKIIFFNFIKVVIFNNQGLGMIKQFQDAYMGGRYAATDKGPGRPDFKKIADAFDFDYAIVNTLEDIDSQLLRPGPVP